MTTSPRPSPPSPRMTPDAPNGEPPHSGFTAVNGKTPSESSSPERPTPETDKHNRPEDGRASAEPAPRDSSDGLRKRRESGEPSPASSDANSQKRQRMTDPIEGDSTFAAGSDDMSSHTSATHEHPHDDYHHHHNHHHNHHHHHPNDGPWAMHERNTSVNSDIHLAQVLQHNMPTDHMGPVQPPVQPAPHHDQRFPIVPSQHSPYQSLPVQMHTPSNASSSQMGQKQRKRNFSNRTKTGCFTCRERKKKCDEAKPTCNNCARGGFTCKGYATHHAFKQQLQREQPPLQAKNGFFEPLRYPQPPLGSSAYHEVPPADMRKHFPMDDGRDQLRAIPPPQEPALGSSYGPQGWPEQSMPQPFQNTLPRVEYQPSVPSLRDPPSQPPPSMHHPPPIPVHPAHNRSTSQHGQHGQHSQHGLPNGQPSPYTPSQAPPTIDKRAMAQSALDHASKSTNIEQMNLSERHKMARGMPFQHNDPSLKEDREACAKEVYRFNKNAIEPKNLSEGARREQFRQIIEVSANSGSPKARNSSPSSDRKLGHLGLRVEVEAPFYCDYGYNLKIGSDVEIGPNCRIMDSGHIEIGDRTIIGPNVTIITLDGDHKAARGPKEKRKYIAKRIIIGEDVFIGAGAIIMPGVSIHKGATIGAGTIVHKNIDGQVSVVNSNDYQVKSLSRY